MPNYDCKCVLPMVQHAVSLWLDLEQIAKTNNFVVSKPQTTHQNLTSI